MDTTTTTTEEVLETVDTTKVETTEQVKTDVPKLLRKQLEESNKEKAELKARLEAIEKAEADKSKTAEEKLAEKDLKIKEYEKAISQKETYFNLEKKLLTENVNPELSDLINSKAKELLNTESNVDQVVEMLKTSYPTAFNTVNKPIGKVGLSVSTGNNSTMSKERALEIINSGDNKLYQSNLKLIAEAIK